MEKIGKSLKGISAKFSEAAKYKVPEGLNAFQLQVWFYDRLTEIIRPRNQSDRTSFRRIGVWLVRQVEDKLVGAEALEKVLHYAQEAAGPDSRNPAAVFMAILKKEMGYLRG